MKKISLFFLLLIAPVLFAATSALAHSFKAGDITIGHPWMTPMEPGQTSAEAYMSFLNNGEQEDALISVTTPVAEKVEIINVIKENGQNKSNTLNNLALAHDRPTPMRPGGMHLLMSGIQKPLMEKDRFPMTLTFAKAGKVDVEIIVHPPKPLGGAGH